MIEAKKTLTGTLNTTVEKVYPPIENLEVTPTKKEQVFTHENSYGYDNVTVNPIPDEYIIPNGTLDINANGETDVTMFRMARIGVHTPPTLQSKEVTPTKETQNITSDEGYDGLNEVVVNPIPNEYVVPSGTLDITKNGEQDVTNYSSVNVSVEGAGAYAPRYITFREYTGTDLTSETEKLDTKNLTSGKNMFAGCTTLLTINVSDWNTSNITSMEYMFNGCNKLQNIDVSNWNTSKVTSMNGTFQGCYGNYFTTLDVSSWDTGKVTNMSCMFYYCNKLTTLNVSGLNTSNVTTMYGMFQQCSNVTTIDVSSWNTGKVTTMENMFSSCYELSSIDLSNWNTSNVTSMRSMFSSCTHLTKVDISSFDGAKITNNQYMFSGCSNLHTLIINNPNVFPMTNITMLNNTPIASGTGYVYVPDDLIEIYRNSTNWSQYANQIKGMSELPS